MAGDEDKLVGAKVGRNGTYVVKKYLAGGSFGKVYIGQNTVTGEEVAIKMEKKVNPKPQLPLEYSFFKILKAVGHSHRGIPKIHYFGECGEWSALVMDLMGPSLENVHQECGQKFTLKTTLMLSIQLMNIFEYFHAKTLIFRDVKPDNFLFGRSGTDNYSTLHIIDLGLCKEYVDDNGEHIKFRDHKGMTGTVRYVSINSHKGYEISRRDDMEAIAYMIIFLIEGELPWMGIKASDTLAKYRKIGKVKENTKPEQLCADIPREFAQYLKDVRKLEFEEKPNYSEYINLFNKAMERNRLKNDGIYDFDKNHKLLLNLKSAKSS